jgi:hypothetical protein
MTYEDLDDPSTYDFKSFGRRHLGLLWLTITIGETQGGMTKYKKKELYSLYIYKYISADYAIIRSYSYCNIVLQLE